MTIKENQSLRPFNTFGLDASCLGLISIYSVKDLLDVIQNNIHPLCILGGGSNILLSGDIPAYILKNEIKGLTIIEEDENQVLVEVGAGEPWHQFVMWSIAHGFAGIENLALIPGTVGAAPMQNIGAYGVEQEMAFDKLRATHLTTGTESVFTKTDCAFGYRESVFKNELKDQYFITHVNYRLLKKDYTLHLQYGDIQKTLTNMSVANPGLEDVAAAVIEIRRSKLPDPKKIGNAGSFFKNPVVDATKYDELKLLYPEIPGYPTTENNVKLPAGWLIEKAGYIGYRSGSIGVHQLQALVLVNYGGGQGKDIQNLAHKIQEKVWEIFGVRISPEVNFW